MPEFKCSHCNYKFKTSTWEVKNKCPYCAREGTLITANNPGIDDVDNFLK